MSFISEYLPCSLSKLKIYLILGALWFTEEENGELLQWHINSQLSEMQIHLEIFQHLCLAVSSAYKLTGSSFPNFMEDLKGFHFLNGDRELKKKNHFTKFIL